MWRETVVSNLYDQAMSSRPISIGFGSVTEVPAGEAKRYNEMEGWKFKEDYEHDPYFTKSIYKANTVIENYGIRLDVYSKTIVQRGTSGHELVYDYADNLLSSTHPLGDYNVSISSSGGTLGKGPISVGFSQWSELVIDISADFYSVSYGMKLYISTKPLKNMAERVGDGIFNFANNKPLPWPPAWYSPAGVLIP